MKRDLERYELARSPFAQRPTQRDIAALLRQKPDDLWRLVHYKQDFIRRRVLEGEKKRHLAYPVERLRYVHERMKFHLNKIKQPDYIFSPRKNKSQRDNAVIHLGHAQFLKIDIKQFYPSTTSAMVRRWFIEDCGMYKDVANLLTFLCTVDGVVSFGSPLTPVLCTLVHKRMFDAIHNLCRSQGLVFSVWVDDITISGNFVPSVVLENIRDIIRSFGLKSHKIELHSGSDPLLVTGIGIKGGKLVAPYEFNRQVQGLWKCFHETKCLDERQVIIGQLLSKLGMLRHIVGARSKEGQKLSDQMNSLRQKREKIVRLVATESKRRQEFVLAVRSDEPPPF